MFTLDTLFITLTLLILSTILVKIRSPKVIIPLAVIYVFFIFNKLSTSNNEKHSEDSVENNKIKIIQPKNNFKTDNLNKTDQTQKQLNKDVRIEQKEIKDQKQLDIQLANKNEKKQTVKKEINTKVKKDEQKKVLKEIKEKQTFNNLLTLKEIKICRNIKNRNPVGIGEIFPSSVDSLYCFTKIENLGKKLEVRHVWFYENQIMTQVRYNVKKSNVYRSWTKKTISSFQIGNWRVEVQDRNGTIIGTKRFKIKKSS